MQRTLCKHACIVLPICVFYVRSTSSELSLPIPSIKKRLWKAIPQVRPTGTKHTDSDIISTIIFRFGLWIKWGWKGQIRQNNQIKVQNLKFKY